MQQVALRHWQQLAAPDRPPTLMSRYSPPFGAAPNLHPALAAPPRQPLSTGAHRGVCLFVLGGVQQLLHRW